MRSINGDKQTGEVATVERVGIGEVFVIAGQSNAQGVHQSAPNPGNDRVNTVNYQYPDDGFPNDPPMPVFTKLDNTPGFTIAPRGIGSWCWGLLGDLLVKRLNVPVMFFNAAFTGTAVQNWRQSAPEGGTAYGVYNGIPYQPRQPYINLKIALQFYANPLGMRAVLWHQGEADNLIKTPTLSYVNDLQAVITQARHDLDRNMSWVVARASYGDLIPGKVGPEIIPAQNTVINSTANVFAGPFTDTIQIPRTRPPLNDAEGFHFDEAGLVTLANAWNNSLDETFFQKSTTVPPAPTPSVTVACAPGNKLTLSVASNFPTVQWSSGEAANTITKGVGIYQAKIKDALGNTFFSSLVRVSDPPVAAVVDNRPPSVCIGSTLNLTANYDKNITWINQQNNAPLTTLQTFATQTAGAFYVRFHDVSGCDFVSNVINVTVNPLPATPTIANDKPTTFCQGDNTVLRASADNVQYNWNDGQKGKTATVGASGAYFLTITDQNGCTSAQSNTIAVTANPVPDKPVISVIGSTTFCADRSVTLTAPQNIAYQWTSGQTTRSLTINQSGNFAVRTRNQFGCTSAQSDIVTVSVNPLPPRPSVTPSGSTTFCEGGRVTLNASSPLDVLWSSGETSMAITVAMSGNYAVQSRDQNGCFSPYSPVISVKVNALPAAPTILSNRPPTICEGDRITLRVDGPYTVFWSTGDSTMSITTGKAGTYSAKVRDVNGCVSAQAGTRTVELKPLPPPPTINAIGTYTLEAVSSTNGTEFRWSRGGDSLAVQTGIIKASQSGTYTARSSTVYSQTLTCFSLPSAPFAFIADVSNRGLSIYPNPNPDKIVFIETLADLANAVVTIYTSTGQVIQTIPVFLFDERKQIILSHLSAGSYIIRVQATNFDVSKRILLGL